jgi:hypothetical protein
VLGLANLNAGTSGLISFTATLAASSATEAFRTIIHEHAHAAGYKIDDLGYTHELALARLERSAPELAPHNADSVAHAALALSGLPGGAKEVQESHAKRHKKIESESAEDSMRAHVLYVLKTAMPFELQEAWPKGRVATLLPKFATRYGATAADWVQLAGKLGRPININDVNSVDAQKDIIYNITLATQTIYQNVRSNWFKSSDIGALELGVYQWMSLLLRRGVPTDPEPAPLAKPVTGLGGDWGKRTTKIEFDKERGRTIRVDAEGVAAAREIAIDGGVKEKGDLDKLVAAFESQPSHTAETLQALLTAALPSGRDGLAAEIVAYLLER